MSNIYLEQANLNPIKTAEHGYTCCPLHKRVMINFTKEACGRGGGIEVTQLIRMELQQLLQNYGPEVVQDKSFG